MPSAPHCNWSEEAPRRKSQPGRMNHEAPPQDHVSPRFRHQRFIAHHKETTTMLVQFKTALAVLFVASMPLYLGGEPQVSSSEPLSTKEVRKAEREARTPEDHLRLAAWYQVEARQTQS